MVNWQLQLSSEPSGATVYYAEDWDTYGSAAPAIGTTPVTIWRPENSTTRYALVKSGYQVRYYSSTLSEPVETAEMTLEPEAPPPPEENYITRLVFYPDYLHEFLRGVVRGEGPDPKAMGDWVYRVNTEDGKCYSVLKQQVEHLEPTTDILPEHLRASCPLEDCEPFINFPPAPPSEWPDFPPGTPEKLRPYWDRMKTAFDTKNKTAMLTVLRELRTLELSPALGLAAIVMIVSVTALITSLLGTFPFAKFLEEETIQTYNMAIFQSMSANQWDLATVGVNSLEEYLDSLDSTDSQYGRMKTDMILNWITVAPLFGFIIPFIEILAIELVDRVLTTPAVARHIPYLNVMLVCKEYRAAVRSNLAIYRELIDRSTPMSVTPVAGNLDMAVALSADGKAFDDYLPAPALTWTFEAAIRGKKDDIDAKYWIVKNYIDAANKDAATTANATYFSTIEDFGNWLLTNKETLDRSLAYPALASYYATEKSKHSALESEIAAITPPVPPPEEKGTLKLVVDPADATISVAGQPEIYMPGSWELDPGTYTIKVTKEGYYDKTTTSIIKAGVETTASITLAEKPPEPPPEPEEATLLIDTIPSGAKIYIDGAYKYVTTPYTIKLDAGTYIVRLELDGYETSEESISLSEGEERTYVKEMVPIGVPPPPPPEVPEVEVIVPMERAFNAWKYTFITTDKATGTEINAKVYIDGEDTGKWTPYYFYLEPVKTYLFRFERWGYVPAEISVTTEVLPT